MSSGMTLIREVAHAKPTDVLPHDYPNRELEAVSCEFVVALLGAEETA